MRIQIENITIADGARGDVVSDWADNWNQIVEVTALPRAAEVGIEGRGNIQTNVSFSVTKEHENYDAAADFLMMHKTEIPKHGRVEITVTGSTGREVTRYFTRAAIQSGSGKIIGQTTIISYQLVGGLMRDAEV